MKKLILPLITNKRGAGAIMMAMLIVVVASTLVSILPSRTQEFAKANRRLFLILSSFMTIEDAAKIISESRGRGALIDSGDIADCNGYSTKYGSGAAGLYILNTPDNAAYGANPKPFAGRLCLPADPASWDLDNEPSSRCFNEAESFDDTTHENDICIDYGDIQAQKKGQKEDIIIPIKLPWVKRKALQAQLFFEKNTKKIKQILDIAPQAIAQRSIRPPVPNAYASVTTTNFANCSTISEDENHVMCQYCSLAPPNAINDNATCIRFSLCFADSAGACDGNLEELRMRQRIIVYGPTAP